MFSVKKWIAAFLNANVFPVVLRVLCVQIDEKSEFWHVTHSCPLPE